MQNKRAGLPPFFAHTRLQEQISRRSRFLYMGRKDKAPATAPDMSWHVTWSWKGKVKAETLVLAAPSEAAALAIAKRQVSITRRREWLK